MIDETFVTMDAHNSRYAISDLGRIFDKQLEKFVSPYIHKSRSNFYYRVALAGSGKHMVHCLVACYHLPIPDCDSKDKVDHLDNNTLNPAASNLTWISNSANIKKSHDITTILIEGRVWKYQRKRSSTSAVSARGKLKRTKRKRTL